MARPGRPAVCAANPGRGPPARREMHPLDLHADGLSSSRSSPLFSPEVFEAKSESGRGPGCGTGTIPKSVHAVRTSPPKRTSARIAYIRAAEKRNISLDRLAAGRHIDLGLFLPSDGCAKDVGGRERGMGPGGPIVRRANRQPQQHDFGLACRPPLGRPGKDAMRAPLRHEVHAPRLVGASPPGEKYGNQQQQGSSGRHGGVLGRNVRGGLRLGTFSSDNPSTLTESCVESPVGRQTVGPLGRTQFLRPPFPSTLPRAWETVGPSARTTAVLLRMAGLLLLILACLSYYDLTRQLAWPPPGIFF